MRAAAIILAATATLAAAQDITKYVPSCAFQCLATAIASGTKCQPLDDKCVCDRANFEAISNGATACVLKACGSDVAVGQVLPGTTKFCQDVLAGAGAAHSSSTPAPPAATLSPQPSHQHTASDASVMPAHSTTTAPVAGLSGSPTPSLVMGGNSTVTSGSPSPAGQTTSRGAATTSAPAKAGAAGATAGGAGAAAAVAIGLLGLL